MIIDMDLTMDSDTILTLHPAILGKLLSDKDLEKANRVMQAMLQMRKIDIQTLLQAHRG